MPAPYNVNKLITSVSLVNAELRNLFEICSFLKLCDNFLTFYYFLNKFIVDVPPWPKEITWYNKEGKVEGSEKYHIQADGIGGYNIEINPVEAMDEGEWKCVATSFENMKQFTTCHVAMSSKYLKFTKIIN